MPLPAMFLGDGLYTEWDRVKLGRQIYKGT